MVHRGCWLAWSAARTDLAVGCAAVDHHTETVDHTLPAAVPADHNLAGPADIVVVAAVFVHTLHLVVAAVPVPAFSAGASPRWARIRLPVQAGGAVRWCHLAAAVRQGYRSHLQTVPVGPLAADHRCHCHRTGRRTGCSRRASSVPCCCLRLRCRCCRLRAGSPTNRHRRVVRRATCCCGPAWRSCTHQSSHRQLHQCLLHTHPPYSVCAVACDGKVREGAAETADGRPRLHGGSELRLHAILCRISTSGTTKQPHDAPGSHPSQSVYPTTVSSSAEMPGSCSCRRRLPLPRHRCRCCRSSNSSSSVEVGYVFFLASFFHC